MLLSPGTGLCYRYSIARMSDLPGFTEADLRRLAGNRSFKRGVDYLDLVTDLDVAANEITATVRGSYDYAVLLETDSGRLSGDCSCPYGQEGNFCKHCVAVGLVVLRAGEDLPLAVAATLASRPPLTTGSNRCPGRSC